MAKNPYSEFFVHAPPNELPRIDAIYVWISVDENGNEGVCAIGPIPAVFAKPSLAEKTLPAIQAIAAQSGRRIRLVKFSGREVVKELKS